MQKNNQEEVIPILEERAYAHKQAVDTGIVRVRTVTEKTLSRVSEELLREDVDVERVQIDRRIDAIPEVREEGDVLIVPVVAEVLVVEKHLVLKEEVRIRRRSTTVPVEQDVPIRSQRAIIEREHLDGDAVNTEVKE